MPRLARLTSLLIFVLTLSGCANQGATPDSERQSVLKMKQDVLTDLYKVKPDVQAQLNSAVGYAVFSNANIYLIFASVGGGYGVAVDNRTGKHTYMKMGELGAGFGAGVKDIRLIMVFHTEASFNRFINHGWAVGGQADAAAKASDKGAAVGGEAILDNVSVYQITESGLALQATIKGTKFWQDAKLN